ncbi:DUF2795 domain-containing protein [Amycolatopsis sp. 195334CR]|nr:DUF2795 domain-containing protein [Amycolatopsis sp. 195334CR]
MTWWPQRTNGADGRALELLGSLPDRQYDGPSGVSHELSVRR